MMDRATLWTKMEQSLPREHGFEPLRVEGELPSSLRGTLFRNGPSLRERFGQRYRHSFDGDGAISAVRFDGELAHGACRLVRTPAFLKEEHAQRPLYAPLASWPKRMLNMQRGESKNPTNVNIIAWADKLWALPELGAPVQIDPHELKTLASLSDGEIKLTTMSAHPHIIPERQELLNYQLHYGRTHELEILACDVQSRWRSLARVTMPGACYVHDFIATARYAVVTFSATRLQLWRAILQWGTFDQLLKWQPELGTKLVIIDLETGKASWHEHEAYFVWHFVNAFERGGQLHIDFIKHQDMRSLDALSHTEHGAQTISPPQLTRHSVDLGTARMTTTTLWDQGCEFPRIDASQVGNAYDKLWVMIERGARQGLASFEHITAQEDCFLFEEDELPSEPIYVPTDKSGEGDGHVISLIYQGSSHTSYAAIFDAAQLERGPIARAYFDHHIPYTFHGDWLAQKI